MALRSEPDTPARLIQAATRHFAARGFYGVSIAVIAEDLGITKQALLHHFGSKEALYSAVLARISDRFMDALGDSRDITGGLERFYDHSVHAQDDMAIILRELLDNEHRAQTARQWFLRPFLERLVDLAQAARPDLSRAEALATLYVFLGAMNYYAVSRPTLRSIFGADEAEAAGRAMPGALRALVAETFPTA
ncbi:TetR/AcrR family transcriptional regulator [Aestuariivita sp.]|jgi:AcrR family transcriptional regulator|uniref:TetR/AcrR family transcriptional regulator n=1 Tax=Aestuariivita sp. TaxID=1872407 RepID=UPI00216EDCA0|nr:TetR/AcrR family transcriptional regulator [Aestuariivita sp.]MCE8006278.1 TetR/AcrR family transcriptional regulator [Aestuariivita sp.]